MAPKKAKVPASWNAKPVTRVGGNSGGVRKPSKPYAKPPAKPTEKPARWSAKTKMERLQEASRTKPKSPAPRPTPKPTGAKGARPMGTADVGPKGPVGQLGQRTGMKPPKPTPATPNAVAANASRVARGLRGAGRLLGPVGTAAMIPPIAKSVFNPKDNIGTRLGKLGNSIERAVGSGGGAGMQPQAQNLSGGRYVPGSQQNYRTSPAKPPAKPKPQGAPQRTATSAGPTSRSSSGGGSSATRSQAPTRTTAATSTAPAQAGRKWEDFNPNRGTSKSNNPLLDREGGYLRQRMKDREATAQASDSMKIKSNFTQEDVYTPKTKVDGSQLDASKIDMNKVKEYDRRKRKSGS